MLSVRDPIHGFIRADDLETALIGSRPMQRLRYIRQLGLTYLIFPGAEHSRFSHALGAMHLAGRVYDHLAPWTDGALPVDPGCRERRLVRAAALLHDVGHAPFSHSAEDLFEGGIDHEAMTRNLLTTAEIREIFAEHDADGEILEPEAVIRVLEGRAEGAERILSQIISGELDVDKMDYLLRDNLYCGVRYGIFDQERLLDTMRPLKDPETGAWGVGVDEGGVHTLEALVLARYYMFTQVYFNAKGKVLELHLNEWMRETGRKWPAEPEAFLAQDDVSVLEEMRRSESRHAKAITERKRFVVAWETREHLPRDEKQSFETLLPALESEHGAGNVLVSNSAKNPHGLGASRVQVQRGDGALEPMEEFSHFLRHLTKIDQYRVYTPPELRDEVHETLRRNLEPGPVRKGEG